MKVLLVGETWISATTHYKGWDSFSTVTYENGGEQFCANLRSEAGIEIGQLPAHLVPTAFPVGAQLEQLQVLILSDIGSNSVLLPPQAWLHGQPSPNRLTAVRNWVEGGGGLAMVGGYMSFQGLNQAARWRETPIADILPVLELPDHPLLHGVERLPPFLGYNRVLPKPGTQVLATVGDDPLLVAWEVGAGRAIAWTTDIGPHWCPEEASSSAGFKRLWRNAVGWLGRSSLDDAAGSKVSRALL
jgi:uncharacterized membrane protein